MVHVATSGVVLLGADENSGSKYSASSKYIDSSDCIIRDVQTNLVTTPNYFDLIGRERILPMHTLYQCIRFKLWGNN